MENYDKYLSVLNVNMSYDNSCPWEKYKKVASLLEFAGEAECGRFIVEKLSNYCFNGTDTKLLILF